MAHNHEYITYGLNEVKELFDAAVMTGTIVSVDTGNDTASVDINDYQQVDEVPIFYHCEGQSTVEGGSTAFSEGDSVYILNKEGVSSPGASDLKIVGFVDGLKPCIMKFYLRLTIDGFQLRHGGQQFKVRYRTTDGELAWTDLKVVRGKDDDAGDTEKYYFCGPFEITGWDSSQPVRIYINYLKDTNYMDPANTTRSINGQTFANLNEIFEYYIANDEGSLRMVVRKEGQWDDWAANWSTSGCPTGGPWTNYTFRRCSCFVQMTSSSPSQEEWPHVEEFTGNWYKDSAPHSKVDSLYKEFSGGEFSALLQNTEERIYNWELEEYEDNPRVISDNLQFNLKGIREIIPRTVEHEDGIRHFPVEDPLFRDLKRIGSDLQVHFYEGSSVISDWFDEAIVGGGLDPGYWRQFYGAVPEIHRYEGRSFLTIAPDECCIKCDVGWAFGSPQKYKDKTFHDFHDLFTSVDELFHVLSEENGAPSIINHIGTLVRDYVDGCQEICFPESCEPIPGGPYDVVHDNSDLNFSIQSINLEEPYF